MTRGGWGATMEFDASSRLFDVEYCAQHLKDLGFAIIRNAVDVGLVNKIKSACAAYYSELEQQDIDSTIESKLYHTYGNIALNSIVAAGFGDAELIFAGVGESAVGATICTYYGEPAVIPRNHTLSRKYHKGNYSTVVPFHQDINAVDRRASVTSWVPLVQCGVVAPGLEVVGELVTEVLPTIGIGIHGGAQIEDGVVQNMFGNTLVHPAFHAGDAILFLNTTPHRSYITPGMTETRYSIELRYMPESLLNSDDLDDGYYRIGEAKAVADVPAAIDARRDVVDVAEHRLAAIMRCQPGEDPVIAPESSRR